MIELNSASGVSYFIEQYSVFRSETAKSGHNAFSLGMDYVVYTQHYHSIIVVRLTDSYTRPSLLGNY